MRPYSGLRIFVSNPLLALGDVFCHSWRMSEPEIAGILRISERSVQRQWSAPVLWRFSNGGVRTESGRGLPQSKTLTRLTLRA